MTTFVRVTKDIFGEYHEIPGDHRSRPRESFFRPARVIAEGKPYDVFTRDVSAGGIGLLHDRAIPTGPAEIEIEMHTGLVITVEILLLWCHCHGSRFFSGAIFPNGASNLIEWLALPRQRTAKDADQAGA
jgi:hypothetical protein